MCTITPSISSYFVVNSATHVQLQSLFTTGCITCVNVFSRNDGASNERVAKSFFVSMFAHFIEYAHMCNVDHGKQIMTFKWWMSFKLKCVELSVCIVQLFKQFSHVWTQCRRLWVSVSKVYICAIYTLWNKQDLTYKEWRNQTYPTKRVDTLGS